MKKRMISMLLALIMVFSFIATMNITAFAENTIDIKSVATLVEVTKGQTMIGICNNLNVTYADVKNGILVANNFTSESQLAKITVGEKIWVPTSKANATAIVKNAYYFDSTGKAVARTTAGGITSIEVDIPSSDVQSYTVVKGDTIGKICKAKSLDYDTCKEAIVKLNSTRFSTVASLGKIQPSWTIYLPTSDDAAKEIVSLITTAEEEIGTSSSSSTSGGDTFWGYVVKHTMTSGETVKSVCNALGKSYSTTISDMVKKMNNLSNLNNVKAGSTYWFPSATSNGTGYTVYSHTVVSGDTVGNLCTARGLTYSNVSQIIAGLNPSTSLNNIKRGQTLLILGGSASSSSSGGVNVVIGGQYTITCNAASNGSVSASATKADYGTKITVTAKPNTNYKTAGVEVINASTKKAITLTASGTNTWTFTMPNANVTISAAFTNSGTLHKLTDTTASASGSLKFQVNGAEATTAYTGDTVTLVPTAKVSGNAYKGATYQYTVGGTSYSSDITGKTFTMPDSDVSVAANFDTTVKITWKTPAAAQGTLTVSYNGSNITSGTSVTKGTSVCFKATPTTGYAVDKAYAGSTELTASSDGLYYFKPSGDTEIKVTFTKSTVYKLTKTCTNCTLSVTANGSEISSVTKDSNPTITITPTANSGYTVKEVTISPSTAGTLTDNNNGTWTLTNVSANLTISASCGEAYNISKETTGCSISSIKVDGTEKTTASSGQSVVFTVAPDSGYIISTIYVEDENGVNVDSAVGKSALGSNKYKFTMPSYNVNIVSEYVYQCVKNTTKSALASKYSAVYKVNGTTVSSGAGIKSGDTLVIEVTTPIAGKLNTHPTFSGISMTSSYVEDTSNVVYTYTGTVGSSLVTMNLDSCW